MGSREGSTIVAHTVVAMNIIPVMNVLISLINTFSRAHPELELPLAAKEIPYYASFRPAKVWSLL